MLNKTEKITYITSGRNLKNVCRKYRNFKENLFIWDRMKI